MEITAAVLRTNDGPYALEPVELAEPRADEVLVRVVGAGMCHTDVIPRGEVSFSPPPIITGHEGAGVVEAVGADRSEEHTSELQSLMRISYAVFCLKKKKKHQQMK